MNPVIWLFNFAIYKMHLLVIEGYFLSAGEIFRDTLTQYGHLFSSSLIATLLCKHCYEGLDSLVFGLVFLQDVAQQTACTSRMYSWYQEWMLRCGHHSDLVMDQSNSLNPLWMFCVLLWILIWWCRMEPMSC